MWYQCFRDKKKSGGDKALLKEGIYFDVASYNKMMEKFSNGPGSAPVYPAPEKPVGSSTYSIYKAMFRRVYREQISKRVLALQWDQIWLLQLDDLGKHVKDRAPIAKKANYEEKVAGAFAPYTIVEHYDEIEAQLWLDSHASVGRRSIITKLRHRYCVLHLTSGILRSESLYRAELSDFLCLKPPKLETDVHGLFLMINQIAQGKTNHGRLLYGRATRHKNVLLCCCGGLSFYLSYRFYVTGEFKDFTIDDWLNNKRWFDVKLLVDVNGSDMTREIQNDSYSRHIHAVLERLNVSCDKLLHLGRNMGSKILDLLEEESEEIRRMGQWNPSIFDNSYSSKLPMGPIRKLAGFYANHKLYFNTRTVIEPDDGLLRSTPMGVWVYDAFDGVVERCNGKHQTAVQVLRFLCELNKVFLQDAAAMMALHPDRCEHPMFADLEVFQSSAFQAFKVRMQVALESEDSPLDANLESVLPGVHQWHTANNAAVRSLDQQVHEMRTEMSSAFGELQEQMATDHLESDKRLAASFMQIASNLLSQETEYPVVLPGTSPQNNHLTTGTLVETPSPGENNAAPTDSTSDMSQHAGFRMSPRHQTLSDLMDEWNGCGKFLDDYGGIRGRNELFGAKWRRHFNNQQYSRTSRIVQAIESFAKEKGMPKEEVVAGLEDLWKQCQGSVANMVKELQARGMIARKTARGKTAKKAASPNGTS